MMSGESHPAQLCRRYQISPSLLYHWKRQYSRGKLNNESTAEGALRDRVEKLERLVGKLTLENEVLKRGLQHNLSRSQRNGRLSGCGDAPVSPSGLKPSALSIPAMAIGGLLSN